MYVVGAGLEARVTDFGLSALASAGCGTQLTSLTLSGAWLVVIQAGPGGCSIEMDSSR